jgi:DNA primase
MYKTLKTEGYGDGEIVKSGLCVERNGKIFDFFRNRVIFPVMDLRGNVIAFGGRILGEGNPKYLNTGETPVFYKRQNLFSLNNAKNSNEGYIILAEGYMDVIALYQAGFTNAVASLGTSFCEEHSRLLKRFTGKVVISFDSDGAGTAATKRAVDILKKDGLNVRVLKLRGAKDPDELIKKFGREAYAAALNGAASGIDYELSLITPEAGFADDDDKFAFLKNAVKILKNITNPLEREIYARKVAETAKVSCETLLAQVKRERAQNKYENQPSGWKKKSVSQSLLKLIIENPSYFAKIRDKIKIDTFKEEIHKKIFGIFTGLIDGGQKPDISMLITKLDEEGARLASEICMEREIFGDFHAYFEDLLKKAEGADGKLEFDGGKDDRSELAALLNKLKGKE